MTKIILKINELQVNTRVDKLLTDLTDIKKLNLTRSKIQELIKNGSLSKGKEIFVQNSYKVKINDEFIFNISENNKNNQDKLKPKCISLNIVYEDEDLIVINKQAGLTTHPGAGNNENTLANALLHFYGNNLSTISGEFRPGIVHRLDKDTSGLLVVAKNDKAHLILSNELEKRILKRNYLGFVWGVLNPKNGKIDGYIERSKINRLKMEMTNDKNARYSLTNYKTLKTFAEKSISMVEFSLDTGRTHQIRVHCSSLGFPLIGDHVYSGNSRHLKKEYNNTKEFVDNFPRQALHSYELSFYQPTTNKLLKFKSPLPTDMEELLKKLNKFVDKKID